MKRIKRILEYQFTVMDLIVLGFLLAIPYGFIGLIWSLFHMEHFKEIPGSWNTFCSFVGQIVAWPVLIICDVDLR